MSKCKMIFLFRILSFNLIVAFGMNEAIAQNKPYDHSQNITVVTNRDAFYPEGNDALYAFISDNVRYSLEAKINYIEGAVMLSFDVLTNGSVANVIILSDCGYGIGEEVVRLIKTRKFSPALQLGKPAIMNVVMTFPVTAH